MAALKWQCTLGDRRRGYQEKLVEAPSVMLEVDALSMICCSLRRGCWAMMMMMMVSKVVKGSRAGSRPRSSLRLA